MNVNAPEVTYTCRDGCGAKATVPADQMPPGWQRGEITGRLRCPACVRALTLASGSKQEDK